MIDTLRHFVRDRTALYLNNVLVRQVLSYVFFSLLSALIPIASIPFLTRHLTTAEYGLYGLNFILVQLFIQFLWLGLSGYLGQQYHKIDKPALAQKMGYCLVFLAAIFTTLCGFLVLLQPYLTATTSLQLHWWFVLLLAALGQTIWTYVTMVWQFNHKATRIGLWRLAQNTTIYGGGCLLILFLPVTWQGLTLLLCLSSLVMAFYGLCWLKCHGYLALPVLTTAQTKHILRFSVPLVPYGIGNTLMVGSDRFIITQFLGTSATGVYTLAYQIAVGLFLLTAALDRAWIPHILELLNQPVTAITQARIRRHLMLACGATLLLTVVYAVCAPYLLYVLATPEYQGAVGLTSLLVLGVGSFSLYKLLVPFFMHYDRTLFLGLIMLLGAAVNVGLNILFIQRYGLIGAAWATLSSYVLVMLITVMVTKKFIPARATD